MNFYAGIFNFSNMVNAKTGVAAITGTTLGYYLTLAYGSEANVGAMVILCLAVFYDWITGIVAAHRDKTLSSAYGLQGVARTFVIVGLPAMASMIDRLFNLPNIFFFLFWGGIFVHTLTSLAANSKRIGWDTWIPDWAINAVTSEIKAKINRAQERLPTPGADPEEVKKDITK